MWNHTACCKDFVLLRIGMVGTIDPKLIETSCWDSLLFLLYVLANISNVSLLHFHVFLVLCLVFLHTVYRACVDLLFVYIERFIYAILVHGSIAKWWTPDNRIRRTSVSACKATAKHELQAAIPLYRYNAHVVILSPPPRRRESHGVCPCRRRVCIFPALCSTHIVIALARRTLSCLCPFGIILLAPYCMLHARGYVSPLCWIAAYRISAWTKCL